MNSPGPFLDRALFLARCFIVVAIASALQFAACPRASAQDRAMQVAIAEIDQAGGEANRPAPRAGAQYPGVGQLLVKRLINGKVWYGAWCTATLIGCKTVLTAAHCFGRPGERRDASVDPDRFSIFFQNAGIIEVESISPMPRLYENCEEPYHDLTLVTLKDNVSTLPFARLPTAHRPLAGESGVVVGFGNYDDKTDEGSGIKRIGRVTVGACNQGDILGRYRLDNGPPHPVRCGAPEEHLVCWDFEEQNANQCKGDSGGPLFIRDGNGEVLVGTSVYGKDEYCRSGDHVWDVDVARYSAWLRQSLGDDLEAQQCGGHQGIRVDDIVFPFDAAGITLVSVDTPRSAEVVVPSGIAKLLFTVNASGSGSDLDLFVRHGAPPTELLHDCKDNETLGNFLSCSPREAQPGSWFVKLVQRTQVEAEFQLTVTMFRE